MDQHFCTACGHHLGSGDSFCTACGTRVDGAPPDATAVRRAASPSAPGRPTRRTRRSRAGFWGWVAAAAVLVAVVSFALGSLVNHGADDADQPGNGSPQAVPTASRDAGSPSRQPTTVVSPDPQALAQAQALHTLIDHSAADKHRIAVAAAQLQSCRHVNEGIQAFEDAAASRDRLVDQASDLQVGLLPGGGAAIASFSKALRASADADRAYVAYGQKRHKVPSGKPRHHHQPMKCTGGKSLERQAVRLSSASHAAKQQTAKEWNLIADQFKLPKVAWTSL